MSNVLEQGLLIAGIGMGLVFLALILLWGLMALMVRIRFKSDETGSEPEEEVSEEVGESAMVEEDGSMHALRMRAVAAAVATALGLQAHSARSTPPAPKELSPWQVARRSGQFSQTNLVTNRKSRGSAR